MTPGKTVPLGLVSAGFFLTVGFLLMFAGRGAREEIRSVFAAGSSGQAVARAIRAEAYAGWVLARAATDGETVATALRAVQAALTGFDPGTPEDRELAARLKGARLDLVARQRAALDRLWVSCRRNRALRDWSGARLDLARILAIAHDPRDHDYRQARRLLDRIAGK